MMFGAQPENMKPEGRRGFPGAQQIDQWPFMLKEYRRHGYVTLLSEDEPYVGAFNFRLLGFKEQPTVKYLRPWWSETRDLLTLNKTRADNCVPKYHLEYLKNFYKEYSKELSFSSIHFTTISHGTPEKVYSIDGDMLQLFHHLNQTGRLDSTAVIFYGDHGSRATAFRATNQGQLEERLPMMTLTLPPSFHKRFPEKINNLKRNSHVLTTPYDIHVTLKHLLSIHQPPIQHKYGRSLFTNIVALNRACMEVGTPQSFCICRKFEKIEHDNELINQIALKMVETINEKIHSNTMTTEKCESLRLGNITKASRLINNKEARKYDTYELNFSVLPSYGLYEGTVEYSRTEKTIKVSENLQRISRYGDQPKCIAHLYPHMRPFCFCKDYKAL